MATKAELAAELSINIGPFSRSLEKAAERAREFSEQASEMGKEIGKGLLGSDLTTLLGIAGATAALGIFTEKLKDFVSEALKGFGKMETSTLKLSLALHNPELARQLAESAESKAGPGYGTAEQLMASSQSLKEAGLMFDPEPGEHKDSGRETTLPNRQHVAPEGGAGSLYSPQSAQGLQEALANLNVLNDKGLDVMSDMIRKWTVKGGEGKSSAKLFEGIPELEPEVAKRIKASGSHQTPEAWVKSHIKSLPDLTKLIEDTATSYNDPNTGKKPVDQKKDTVEGVQQKFAADWEKTMNAVGKDLAPEFKTILNDFEAALPAITKILETSFGGLAEFLDTFLRPKQSGLIEGLQHPMVLASQAILKANPDLGKGDAIDMKAVVDAIHAWIAAVEKQPGYKDYGLTPGDVQ